MMKGKPLTLEQLREMEGQPVYVERNEEPHDGKWFIVDYADTINPDMTLYTRDGTTYSDYGVYFTAYDRPSTAINREAWEPCRWCNSEYTIEDDDFGWPVKRSLIRYCWRCGRPITEEAWAELEERLEESKK